MVLSVLAVLLLLVFYVGVRLYLAMKPPRHIDERYNRDEL
jgi:hypothetical protein